MINQQNRNGASQNLTQFPQRKERKCGTLPVPMMTHFRLKITPSFKAPEKIKFVRFLRKGIAQLSQERN